MTRNVDKIIIDVDSEILNSGHAMLSRISEFNNRTGEVFKTELEQLWKYQKDRKA